MKSARGREESPSGRGGPIAERVKRKQKRENSPNSQEAQKGRGAFTAVRGCLSGVLSSVQRASLQSKAVYGSLWQPCTK